MRTKIEDLNEKINNVDLGDIHIGLSNWYTKKTGRVAMFYKA